jgi:hypothetical protein
MNGIEEVFKFLFTKKSKSLLRIEKCSIFKKQFGVHQPIEKQSIPSIN